MRLHAPRYLIERDEVTLSSTAHNYLDKPQLVRAELVIARRSLEPLAAGAVAGGDAGEELTLQAEATVPARGEHRFDWPMRALTPGPTKVVARALSAEESDAVEWTVPVLVHGVEKQFAQSGSFRPAINGTRTLTFELPGEIDPARSRLAVTLQPSLAHVLVGALPFLTEYPYECVEQTMSRFYPVAIVSASLQRMGTNLDTISARRAGTLDAAAAERLIANGLARIADLQQRGGWGWWKEDRVSLSQTAYVVQGLLAAQAAGIKVEQLLISSGLEALAAEVRERSSIRPTSRTTSRLDTTTEAFAVYVLGLHLAPDAAVRKVLQRLFTERATLTHQGRALLALALHRAGQRNEAALVLRNLRQFVERDEENETAWIRPPAQDWWTWYENDIETNAWLLRALLAIEPQGDLAPRVVKWLVQNRAGGRHWRSTRDTALAIAAVAEFVRVSGEEAPDFTAIVTLDSSTPRELRVNRSGLFGEAQRVELAGAELKPGRHTVTLTKLGRGALYYAASLEFFTREADIQSAGGDLAIEREYFRLVPRSGERTAADFERIALPQGEAVRSGEEIEVVLRLKAKNTYDFLAFEDRKPAGCEPVEVRSGGTFAGGFCANVELRESKVVFFIAELPEGEHQLTYRLRAEAPGVFRAPPPTGFAMYAPELRANGRTMRLKVEER